MPGVKPTNEELLDRVEFVQELLCRGLNHSQIKRAFRQRYGPDVHATTVGRYVLRARKAFARELTRTDLNAKRAEHIRICNAIIRNEQTKAGDKIRALERIADLLGLDVPFRHEHSGPNGSPIEVTTEDKTIDFAELEQLRQKVYTADGRN
jgi:hypothetical protein